MVRTRRLDGTCCADRSGGTDSMKHPGEGGFTGMLLFSEDWRLASARRYSAMAGMALPSCVGWNSWPRSVQVTMPSVRADRPKKPADSGATVPSKA